MIESTLVTSSKIRVNVAENVETPDNPVNVVCILVTSSGFLELLIDF